MTSRDIPRAQDQLFKAGGGARAKYSPLVVGKPGLGALLKHEFVVLLAQAVPGALGLALRKWMYPWLLGSCGRNVVFGQNVVLRHPHKIRIGDSVVIDDNCLLDAKGETNAGITIGSGVFVGRNTILSCKNGDIELADEANIGFNCEMFSASRVRGRARHARRGVRRISSAATTSSAIASKAVLDQAASSRGITIGAGAWLGAGATILDGVTIGDRAIVGAGAVVRDGRAGRGDGGRRSGALVAVRASAAAPRWPSSPS